MNIKSMFFISITKSKNAEIVFGQIYQIMKISSIIKDFYVFFYLQKMYPFSISIKQILHEIFLFSDHSTYKANDTVQTTNIIFHLFKIL